MVTTPQILTLDEYFAYDYQTDQRYELVNGELRKIPPECDFNSQIASYLFAELLNVVSCRLMRCKGTEIVISGAQATVRIPDLLVLNEELLLALRQSRRETITLDMPPPTLVIEVVSPGKDNANRDYRYKHSEYAARGIAEYWIVDPLQAQVSVLTLVEGLYEDAAYTREETLVSPLFPTLELTAEQVLQGGEEVTNVPMQSED